MLDEFAGIDTDPKPTPIVSISDDVGFAARLGGR
jgi:hypothetical protein